MAIPPIRPDHIEQLPPAAPRQSPGKPANSPAPSGFAALLNKIPDYSQREPMAAEAPAPNPAQPSAEAQKPGSLIPVGEISKNTPSVSHILTSNTAFQHESWDIIFAKVNQGKQFKSMQQGVMVSLDPASKELVWAESQSHPIPMPKTDKSAQPPPGRGLALPTVAEDDGKTPSAGPEASPTQITIGAIDRKHPTISHLLKKSPQYRDKAWEIIFSAANRNKPYDSLQPGCLVSIDPKTLELSFQERDAAPASPILMANNDRQCTTPAAPEAPVEEQKIFAEKLANSVKSYIGQPYRKIDCYGLVVRGLANQGVQYAGSGGLLQHLERLAADQGLPANAYQNGEGLIEIAGNKLYDQSFVRIKDAERQSAKVLEQLQPLLQEGMLLSFSTPSRGHTGVIAKKAGQWTYVNSGVIDHQVNGGKEVSWRVGEENLAEEIKNWFLLAKNERTSLKVSAGLFDTQRLKAKGSMMANSQSPGQDVI